VTEPITVLEAPEPKPDWQCRHEDCSQPVFGNVAYCTACAILFGPYDILVANHRVTEWIPEEHLVEHPVEHHDDQPEKVPEPTSEPEKRPPTARRRTRTPKAKPDAG
jgi:hypothetical protein